MKDAKENFVKIGIFIALVSVTFRDPDSIIA
jgi:hypothetical protein